MSWIDKVRNGIPFLPKRQGDDQLWHKCKQCETWQGGVVPGSHSNDKTRRKCEAQEQPMCRWEEV